MERSDVAVVAGLAGFLLGGWAVFVAIDARSETQGRWADVQEMVKSDNETLGGLGEKVKDLEESTAGVNRKIGSLANDPKNLWESVQRLQARVDALEKDKGPPKLKDDAPTVPDPKSGTVPPDFDALQSKMLSGEATPDEQQRFWAMLRENPAILADQMARLEKAVADDPGNAESRMQLAQAYTIKLLTVPPGPEQAAWSTKGMEQYKKILELDPNHWGARYRLAFNYSQWPDFLNKRPDAIKEFETLRKIQENATPHPEHAQVYFQLRQLYLKDGRTDDAKSVLEEGLRRFPDDEELKKARDGAK